MSKKRLPFRTQAARDFYTGVCDEYELSVHHLEILKAAADCIDRMDYAQNLLKDGDFYLDRWNQPKPHPALKVLQDNKVCLARLCRELRLDDGADDDFRIPSIVKSKRS